MRTSIGGWMILIALAVPPSAGAAERKLEAGLAPWKAKPPALQETTPTSTPAASPAAESLERAIDATRGLAGMRFTFRRDQRQEPHDPIEQEGRGVYRSSDHVFAFLYSGSGASRWVIRRGESGVFWDDFVGTWRDLRHLDMTIGRGLVNPEVLLDVLSRRLDRATVVRSWDCADCEGLPGRPPREASPQMWRMQLEGDAVHDVLNEMGFDAEYVRWEDSRSCLTLGADADGRLTKVWVTGQMRFTEEAELSHAEAGLRVEVSGYDVGDRLGTVDFEGVPVDLDAGVAALNLLEAAPPPPSEPR